MVRILNELVGFRHALAATALRAFEGQITGVSTSYPDALDNTMRELVLTESEASRFRGPQNNKTSASAALTCSRLFLPTASPWICEGSVALESSWPVGSLHPVSNERGRFLHRNLPGFLRTIFDSDKGSTSLTMTIGVETEVDEDALEANPPENVINVSRRRWQSAHAYVLQLVESDEPITLDVIERINALLNFDDADEALSSPAFRRVGELTSSRCYDDLCQGVYVDKENANRLSPVIVATANDPKLHPVVKAAKLYQDLCTLHLFENGNGRTARLVVDLILMRHGYPPPFFDGHLIAAPNFVARINMSSYHNTRFSMLPFGVEVNIADFKLPETKYVPLSEVARSMAGFLEESGRILNQHRVEFNMPSLVLPDINTMDALTLSPSPQAFRALRDYSPLKLGEK